MKGECCSPLNSNSAQVHILTETILNFRFWILDWVSLVSSPVFQDGRNRKFNILAFSSSTL